MSHQISRLKMWCRIRIPPSRCSTRSAVSGGTTKVPCCCGCLILALFGSAVALFGRNLPPDLKANVLGVQGSISRRVPSGLYRHHIQSVCAHVHPAPFEGSGLNPNPAGPGAVISSAVSLHGLCRVLDSFFFCHCRSHYRTDRPCLGAVGASVDARPHGCF